MFLHFCDPPNLVFTFFSHGAEGTLGVDPVGESISSSRALFPPTFAPAGLEDERVGAKGCTAVGVLTPLAVFEPLRRVDGFGFGFPLGDLGV